MSRDPFLHFGARAISLEQMKDISNLACRLNVKSTGIISSAVYGVHFGSCDLLKLWEISANISEMVQDRHIVTMED